MSICRYCDGIVGDLERVCPHCAEANPVAHSGARAAQTRKQPAAHPFVVVQFASLIAFWIAYAVNAGEEKISNQAFATFFVTFVLLCLIFWRVCRSIAWEVQEKYLYPISALPCVISFVWAIFW